MGEIQNRQVAQTPGFGVCGSSLDSRSRIRGQTPVFGILGFFYRRAADLKGGGLRYARLRIPTKEQQTQT
jgi:hypothetical protein